ncbi:hypothetical protein A9485_23810 [Bacillus cereus]|uniref:protein-export chaperone SecB n=1 Tax=Bacillus cereus TaxID=1396 RepID=UPI0004724BB6|nr:protein-export chaperone SecB [Bacillus cereus]OJE00590.1 hypothetical protein A9485_23810 [Bacillus cereus]
MSEESYSLFIEAIDFKNIEVISLECRQNEGFKSEGKMLDIYLDHYIEKATMSGVELDVKVGFNAFAYKSKEEIQNPKDDVGYDDKLFEVNFTLKLKYSLNLEEDEETLIKISSDEELMNLFVERNVPINVWPYAREIISNVTMKMGFPPLMIPPYKSAFEYKG